MMGKLKEAGIVMMEKGNMDEFMGIISERKEARIWMRE